MNRTSVAALGAFAGIAVSLSLTGCALGTAAFPDTGVASPTGQVTMGAVQGNDYGGHAPLVGTHVGGSAARRLARGVSSFAHRVAAILGWKQIHLVEQYQEAV